MSGKWMKTVKLRLSLSLPLYDSLRRRKTRVFSLVFIIYLDWHIKFQNYAQAAYLLLTFNLDKREKPAKSLNREKQRHEKNSNQSKENKRKKIPPKRNQTTNVTFTTRTKSKAKTNGNVW